MKKLAMLLISGIALFPSLIAQKITTDKVPVLVMRAFMSKFPESNQQSWGMEAKDVYEVDFYNGKKRQSATFDSNGGWLETETEIQSLQVPRPVTISFYKQFDGYTIQEILLVETPDKGNFYEYTINKGKGGYEVQFSAKGDLIKKEAAKEEE